MNLLSIGELDLKFPPPLGIFIDPNEPQLMLAPLAVEPERRSAQIAYVGFFVQSPKIYRELCTPDSPLALRVRSTLSSSYPYRFADGISACFVYFNPCEVSSGGTPTIHASTPEKFYRQFASRGPVLTPIRSLFPCATKPQPTEPAQVILPALNEASSLLGLVPRFIGPSGQELRLDTALTHLVRKLTERSLPRATEGARKESNTVVTWDFGAGLRFENMSALRNILFRIHAGGLPPPSRDTPHPNASIIGTACPDLTHRIRTLARHAADSDLEMVTTVGSRGVGLEPLFPRAESADKLPPDRSSKFTVSMRPDGSGFLDYGENASARSGVSASYLRTEFEEVSLGDLSSLPGCVMTPRLTRVLVGIEASEFSNGFGFNVEAVFGSVFGDRGPSYLDNLRRFRFAPARTAHGLYLTAGDSLRIAFEFPSGMSVEWMESNLVLKPKSPGMSRGEFFIDLSAESRNGNEETQRFQTSRMALIAGLGRDLRCSPRIQ